MSGFVEKKENLLGSTLWLIIRERQMPRHTTVENIWMMEWANSRRPEVGTYKSLKRVSNAVEPEEYRVNGMFTQVTK